MPIPPNRSSTAKLLSSLGRGTCSSSSDESPPAVSPEDETKLPSHYILPRNLDADHLRRRTFLRRLDLFPGLFLFEQINQRILVSVLELCRIKVARLGLDDVRCEIEHLIRGLHLRNVFEIGLFVANFIRIPQGRAAKGRASSR